jgi:hypothetical protein
MKSNNQIAHRPVNTDQDKAAIRRPAGNTALAMFQEASPSSDGLRFDYRSG